VKDRRYSRADGESTIELHEVTAAEDQAKGVKTLEGISWSVRRRVAVDDDDDVEHFARPCNASEDSS